MARGSPGSSPLIGLAAFGVLTSLAVVGVSWDSFSAKAVALIGPWVASPLPVAAWIGARVVGRRGFRLLVAGLTVAGTVGAWAYWDAFLGPASRTQSLAGLIVVVAPALQAVWLALVLCLAWWLGRDAAARPASG